jgi:hypothetical protein
LSTITALTILIPFLERTMIDLSDEQLDAMRFGASEGGSGAMAVPEQTAAMLMLVGSVAALRRRRVVTLLLFY